MADETTTAATGSTSSGTGNVTSGTASASLIAAAMAAESSPAPSSVGASTGTTTPPSGNGTPGTSAAATGQTGEVATASGKPLEGGPIPLDRHKAILENARKQFEWAKDLNADEVKTALRFMRGARSNPQGFHSWLSKQLGNGQGGQDQQPKSFPQPKLKAEDGTAAYSADQMPEIVEVIRSQMREEMRPIADFTARLQAERGEAEVDAEHRRVTTTALKHARELPQFKENETAIAEKLYGMDKELKQTLGPTAAMYLAYAQVMQESVLPTYDKTAEQRVREEFARKANTSRGSVAPSGSDGAAGKVNITGVDSLARHMERLAAAATTA